jgi:hypothetical protein
MFWRLKNKRWRTSNVLLSECDYKSHTAATAVFFVGSRLVSHHVGHSKTDILNRKFSRTHFWKSAFETLLLRPCFWNLAFETLLLRPCFWDLVLRPCFGVLTFETSLLGPRFRDLVFETSLLRPRFWDLAFETLLLRPRFHNLTFETSLWKQQVIWKVLYSGIARECCSFWLIQMRFFPAKLCLPPWFMHLLISAAAG